MRHFEDSFGKWVVRNRWWLVVLTLLAMVVSVYGIRFLSFNNDSRVYFSEENPHLMALEKLEKVYSKDNNVLFAVVPDDGNVFTSKTLSAIEKLTEAAWRIPYSSRVDSITNFQNTSAGDDELIVEDLVIGAKALTNEELLNVRERALTEPLLVNQLVSPSGHVAGVNVLVTRPGESLGEVPRIVAYARELADEMEAEFPHIDIRLAGGTMLDNAFGEASRNDTFTLVPLMIAVLMLIVFLSLRSFAATLSVLAVIFVAMLSGLGLAGWMGIILNPTSVQASVIILTLAVADSIHILASMFQFMGKDKARHEAIAESIRVNLLPVFLTSITTAVGFLSMNFSDAPPFRDLGNIVAIGVVSALVYSVFSLPAFLALIPIKGKNKTHGRLDRLFGLQNLSGFVIRRRRLVFWGMSALAVIIATGMLGITLDDDFIKYFDTRYEVRRDLDFVEDNLGGLYLIEYSLDSGEPGGINNPGYLETVEKFAKWFRTQPGVAHVRTITDIMKRLNRNMHADREEYYRIPDSRELAAQYLLLYEMSLPFGLDLNSRINVEKSSTRMTVTLRDITMSGLRATDERARLWLRENAPRHMYTYGSGLSIMFSYISMRNIRSMLGASFLALLIISCLLFIAFRSFKFGLLSLVPNLTPALMGLGLWGFAVGRVGLVVSVIAAMTMGIVVDDTIHFMSKYLRARREHRMHPSESVRYAFNTVGAALLISTLALTAGFLVLACSGFALNAHTGLMTAITIVFALFLDFLFLPALLLSADRGVGETSVFSGGEVKA